MAIHKPGVPPDQDLSQKAGLEGEQEEPFKLEPKKLSEMPSGIEGEILDIKYWGEYTMIIAKDKDGKSGDRIIMYDAHGERVDDFDQINKLEIKYDKQKILSDFENFGSADLINALKKNVVYISADNSIYEYPDQYGVYKRHATPEHFRIFLRSGQGENEIKNRVFDSANVIFDRSKIFITNNGKYIVNIDTKDSRKFIIYDTNNAAGKPDYPRNWKRYDNSSPLELPDELKQALDSVLVSLQTLNCEPISATREAIVDPDKVTVAEGNKTIHEEKISGVNDNLCVEAEKNVYFCRTENPTGIWMLDTSGNPTGWQAKEARFSKKYPKISGLDLDPTGSFFVFSDGQELVLLDKNDLSELGRIDGLQHVQFLPDGKIRAVDSQKNMVVYETDLERIVKQRAAAKKLVALEDVTAGLFKGIQGPGAILQPKTKTALTADFSYLDERKARFNQNILPGIQNASTFEEIQNIEGDLQQLEGRLQSADISAAEVKYLLGDILELFHRKKAELANRYVDEIVADISAKAEDATTLTDIIELNRGADSLEALRSTLTEAAKAKEVSGVIARIRKKTTETYRVQTEQIQKDIEDVVKHAEAELAALDNKLSFDDWTEYTLPQLKERLARIGRECPLEVHDIHAALLKARGELTQLAQKYEEKFKVEYVRIRQEAATKLERTTQLLEEEIAGLFDRARTKQFTSRLQAEEYFDKSPAHSQLFAEIEALATRDPDRSAKLKRDLNVKKSVFLNEIERGSNLRIKETGQQIVMFGETEFAVWESAVKKKQKPTVELTFLADERTKGPGVTADRMVGDVGLRITDAKGKNELMRLYQDREDEDDWRYGSLNYRGKPLSPSYISQGDYREVKSLYADWNKGKNSKIRQELAEKRKTLKDLYKAVKAAKETGNEAAASEAAEKYKAAFLDYANFADEKKVLLLRQIDRMKNFPQEIETNGKGYVPEWQSHWVLDPQTEKYLGEMAGAFKMQSDLQEGMLLLKGHAGTGKDVLMKMFCERTRRPYFAVDCSKWTTEFELSEDIVLESEDGASKTVKVPSTVLVAIQTPGAVLYFNEFNAMPEVAQIFLHALMDEKRSITLKTSSGKTIKAHPSLLIASSMNPGYPGTFDPQMATRSRTVPLNIEYPKLYREKEAGDTLPGNPLDASEALRVARGVASLVELTYEPNMQRNEFVKMWDKYVNGLDTGAPAMTKRQQFDVDTILTLVEFGEVLRNNFMAKFEKGPDSRKALPVPQPFTLREMRRCAYVLSQMTDEERAKTNADQCARDLIEKFFLCHIDKEEDKRVIKTAMASWTSKKRV